MRYNGFESQRSAESLANDRNPERRPDPTRCWRSTEKGKRGKLLVFLGAAPGVGKTYAMLQRARLLREEGVDIVVGLVETHSRAETEALTRGLEILPRKKVRWQGREIEEFDLDGALRRRPKLIIVDELAHTNAPESRHPKRWQDVEELLDARIDVWTALNIQHLESLADVVSRITGVTVRETVPDIVLRDADDIVLVDITSEDLIQRLKDGKVYLAETARLAQQKFFTLRNLTALREIALRRTAARVDDQMVEQLRQGAIGGPWETSRAPAGLRRARRAVDGRGARGEPARDRPQRELGGGDGRPAERRRRRRRRGRRGAAAGAEPRGRNDPAGRPRPAGRNPAATPSARTSPRSSSAARRRASSAASPAARFPTRWRGARTSSACMSSPATSRAKRRARRRFARRARPRPADRRARRGGFGRRRRRRRRGARPLAAPAQPVDDLPHRGAGLRRRASACARRSWRRCCRFSPTTSSSSRRYYQFTIAEPQEFFALVIFLAVASLVGWLAGRARDQERLARDSAQATRSLFEFSRKLSGAATLDDILDTTTVYAQKTLEARGVVMLLPEDGELPLSAAWPPIDELDPGENGAARWAFDKSEPAGWKTGTLPNVRFQFRPLVTSRGVVGVCGFEPADRDAPISPTLEHALNLILEQAAIAIDRALLVKDSVRTVALEENEKLRGTLLASLSHDLRTPLATITGAVTTLRKFGDGMAPEQRADLLASIEEESGPADPLHRQSARHVADRSRRAEAQAAISSTSSRSSARRSSARARSSSASRSSPAWRATCPMCAATPICSSRCCSTCSTMRRNTAAAGG